MSDQSDQSEQPDQSGPSGRAVPPITEAMRVHARSQPNTWLYVVDPSVDPAGEVPRDKLVGAYPVDADGELEPDFQANPDYVPSEDAFDLPAPSDPLEAALHALAAGHGSREAVLALLRTTDLMLVDTADGGLVLHETAGGNDVVQAFTSPEQAHAAAGLGLEGAGWQRRLGRELARMLPKGVDLQLNPGSAVSVTVPRESLLR